MHRYASDARVATMLVHLARHFFFDRYRSFRAFSWVTGVALLWLVLGSGINGYMLPWDRLAQYVTIATAEWLDALPVFRGTLARNFVFAEAILADFPDLSRCSVDACATAGNGRAASRSRKVADARWDSCCRKSLQSSLGKRAFAWVSH